MKKLFATGNNAAATIVRIMLGLVIFPHGAQKLLGWYGGFGFTGMMQYFTDTMHLPWLIGFIVILVEFFGALFLIAGFATRINSLLMIAVFLGVIFTTNIHNGFFMNWFGNQKGEGMEFSLLVLGMAASLVVSGGGAASADRLIVNRLNR